ncbi:hypothetical protein, partial [Nocardioides stalactiti]|uniref:hypothetical protein n=1 Tax=Nocardioides stalactiti TaxID=2755356 RepID=UPI001C7FC53A
MALDEARAALDDGDFRRALGLVDASDSSEAALEVVAVAAYGAGELERSLTALERLYAQHVAAQRPVDAGFAAARVAINLLCETGLMAPVRGWVARAERQVAGQPVGPVHALLAAVRACERVLSGGPDA